jgi:hypothetical protein
VHQSGDRLACGSRSQRQRSENNRITSLNEPVKRNSIGRTILLIIQELERDFGGMNLLRGRPITGGIAERRVTLQESLRSVWSVRKKYVHLSKIIFYHESRIKQI